MLSMLLISLMRSTPPFWMPDLRARSSRNGPLYREDEDPLAALGM